MRIQNIILMLLMILVFSVSAYADYGLFGAGVGTLPDVPSCGYAYDINAGGFKVSCGVEHIGDYSLVAIELQYRIVGTSTWTTSSSQLFTGIPAGSSGFDSKIYTVTGLSSNTNYEYRGRLVFSAIHCLETSCYSGSAYEPSPYKSLTTSQIVTIDTPDITTLTATNVGEGTARLRGTVDLDDYDYVDAKFYYRKVGTTTWSSTAFQGVSADGDYYKDITGLLAGTQYEYQAYISYWSGDCTIFGTTCPSDTKYGAKVTFTTTGGQVFTAPTITTLQVASVDTSSATLYGSVDPFGNATYVDTYFEYGLNYFGSSITTTDDYRVMGGGTYWEAITGLDENSEYKFRFCGAYLNPTFETSTCGNWIVFNTLSASSIVAYYNFTQGNSQDVSGNNYDGIDTSMSYSADGAEFDGLASRINLTSLNALEFSGDFSIRIRFSLDSVTGLRTILYNRNYGDSFSKGYGLYMNGASLTYQLSNGSQRITGAIATLSLNTTYDMIFNFDRNQNMTVYNNGVRIFSTIISTQQGSLSTSDYMLIGAGREGATYAKYFYSGSMHTLTFYSQLLTLEQITELYYQAETGITEPSVDIFYPNPIDSTSMTLRGALTSMGSYDEVTTFFGYKKSTEFGYIDGGFTNRSATSASFSYGVAGMTANTLYDIRLCAQTPVQLTCEYSQVQTLATASSINDVVVETQGASSINESSATVFGLLSDMGEYEALRYFFYYKLYEGSIWIPTAYYAIYDPSQVWETITGLDDNEFYSYKFCALDDDLNEICGDEELFYTNESVTLPTISIQPATNVMERSARFVALISDLAGYASLDYYFTYKKSSDSLYLSFTSTSTTTSSGAQTVYDDVYTLVGDTQYDVKMCVDIGIPYCTASTSFNTTAVTNNVFVAPTTPDSDNTFDDIWDIIFQGSYFMKLLMGFFIVLAVLFMGINGFGKMGMQMGSFAMMIFLFIGVVLATLLKLFPMFIMILFLVGGILLIVLKQMFFGGASGGD